MKLDNGNYIIDASAGDVTVIAGNGNDTIIGGAGDVITLGNGNDTVLGGSSETIKLGNGSDTVSVGDLSTIAAGNGTDTITAGSGSSIIAGNGNDTIKVGHNSSITVGNGHDVSDDRSELSYQCGKWSGYRIRGARLHNISRQDDRIAEHSDHKRRGARRADADCVGEFCAPDQLCLVQFGRQLHHANRYRCHVSGERGR